MSEVQQLQGFGFQDDGDKALQSKSSGKFGLNLGRITKFEYNPNSGKDGSTGDGFDITVEVGDRKYMQKIFAITKVFGKDNTEITDQTDPQYITNFNNNMTQMKAVFTHFLKVFRTEAELKMAFQNPPASFADYFKLIESLKPDNFASIPVDVFLEYQWKIKGDNTRTFLQLPQNMKGGYFIGKALPATGSWSEERDEKESLIYKDGAGNTHPFNRSKDYLESPKGYQQIEGEESGPANPMGAATTEKPKPSTWGNK